MRRVLCAIDVERSSATSLAMASLLGERFEASVDVLYASLPASLLADTSARMDASGDRDARERLSGVVASVTSTATVSSFVTPGSASAVILAHAERHTSDLIVMASSPHRRVSFPARTIVPVSEGAPCAVLTVGDRFRPAALRRILLPVGLAGADRQACRWVTTLASRFDAEVGLVRVGRAELRSPLIGEPGVSLPCEEVLATLCRAGIDAYEIAHPGGADDDALAQLCEAGAFDAIVTGLPAADTLVAAVRHKTSAPVLSVRAIPECSRSIFADSCARRAIGVASLGDLGSAQC